MATVGWSREFAKGWTELQSALQEGARWQRAKYIVESGIKEGHSIKEITKATETTNWALSTDTIRDYIDFYGVSKGATEGHAHALGVPLVAPKEDLEYAIRQYETPDVSQKEVDDYVKDTGASEDVARRILERQAIGESLREEGLIDDDGHLTIKNPAKELDKAQRASERLIRNANKSRDNWMRAFGTYWARMNDFLGFLRYKKQDDMRDSTIARKLRRMAAELDNQAERYETGHSKFKARQAAASKKGVRR